MFSPADVRALLNTFPSDLVHLSIDDSTSSTSHDRLIINSYKTGFVRSCHLRSKLERLLKDSNEESGKLEVEDIAKQLHVNSKQILRLATESRPGAALVTRDQRFIFTNESRNGLLKQLYEEATTAVINQEAFLVRNDVLHIEGLDFASMYESYAKSSKGSLQYVDLAGKPDIEPLSMIYSDRLRDTVKDALRKKFQEAHEAAIVCTISDADFEGVPISFLETLANICLAADARNEWQKGELSVGTTFVRYTPESHAKGNATQTLEALANGDRTYLDYHQFESLKATSGFESSGLDGQVTLFPRESPRWVVSNSRLEKWQKEAQVVLSDQGFVLLQALKYELPKELKSLIVRALTQKLVADSTIVELGDAVARKTLFEKLSATMLDAASIQASEDWKEGADRPLNNDRIFAILSENPQVKLPEIELVKRMIDGDIRRELTTAFTNVSAEMAAATEQEFEVFWTEKVAYRTQLYRLGLDGISDAKLHDQLEDVLRVHVSKELVPEQISRAKTRSLIRGKKTTRETEKLQEKAQQAASLAELFEVLDKFNAKQMRTHSMEDGTDNAKESHVVDLRRGMRKDKDNARLFLTVVIVLLARHKAGVTYATGKYAPKLLKLLKGLVDDATYQELNDLKEKVKGGSITAQDRTRMIELAEL